MCITNTTLLDNNILKSESQLHRKMKQVRFDLQNNRVIYYRSSPTILQRMIYAAGIPSLRKSVYTRHSICSDIRQKVVPSSLRRYHPYQNCERFSLWIVPRTFSVWRPTACFIHVQEWRLQESPEESTHALYVNLHVALTHDSVNNSSGSNQEQHSTSKSILYAQQQLQSITQLCHADHRYLGLVERCVPFPLTCWCDRSIPPLLVNREVKAGILLCLLGDTPPDDSAPRPQPLRHHIIQLVWRRLQVIMPCALTRTFI